MFLLGGENVLEEWSSSRYKLSSSDVNYNMKKIRKKRENCEKRRPPAPGGIGERYRA